MFLEVEFTLNESTIKEVWLYTLIPEGVCLQLTYVKSIERDRQSNGKYRHIWHWRTFSDPATSNMKAFISFDRDYKCYKIKQNKMDKASITCIKCKKYTNLMWKPWRDKQNLMEG
jgi:hypothetical protein